MGSYDTALLSTWPQASSNQRQTRSRWIEGRETNREAGDVVLCLRGLAKKGTRDRLSLTPVSKMGREMTTGTTITASGSKGPFQAVAQMREWASLATQPIGLDESSKAGKVGWEWRRTGERPGSGDV